MAQKIIGPFKQILTMAALPAHGPINDEELEIISNAFVLLDEGKIIDIVPSASEANAAELFEIKEDAVLLPGLIDSHTHICYAGSRAKDYASRLAGKSYLEIAQEGGGILDTVRKTREASQEELEKSLLERSLIHMKRGVTTCEVKSGYGLSLDAELKMLRAINKTKSKHIDLVATCLAAHTLPPEFDNNKAYLDFIINEILPNVKEENLAKRVDIFVEKGAFEIDESIEYLNAAKKLGFSLTVHADQFSQGGSEVAAKVAAISADHLEVSSIEVVEDLARHNVIATVLPGASIGLGLEYAPARLMLDNNLSLVIASDWNPGSAPMGDLLAQAAIIGAQQKLSMAETLAAITIRAAGALELSDRGKLSTDMLADMIAFPCNDFREVLYNQGSLKPSYVWKRGELLHQ